MQGQGYAQDQTCMKSMRNLTDSSGKESKDRKLETRVKNLKRLLVILAD